MHFLGERGITLVVLYSQGGGGRLVICNNYIKKVILADLKWNKHECLMHPLHYASHPPCIVLGLLRIHNYLFYSWPSL